MGSAAPAGAVVILSRLLLISQAVGAALRGRGIDAETESWTASVRRATHDLTESDVVLLFDDLEGRGPVLATQELIAVSSARFLVLTHSAEGPPWGALLASGAAGLMPTDSTLDEVDVALRLVREGGDLVSGVRRSRLERAWFRWLAEDDDVRARLAGLSPRQRQILERLADGSRVCEIATELGLGETTVRSHIKSIRRKLDVRSQLAAVAMMHRQGGQGPLLLR